MPRRLWSAERKIFAQNNVFLQLFEMENQCGVDTRAKFLKRLQRLAERRLVRDQQAGRAEIGERSPFRHAQPQRDAPRRLCAALQQTNGRQCGNKLFGIEQQVGGEPLLLQQPARIDAETRHDFKIAGERRRPDIFRHPLSLRTQLGTK